MDPAIPIARVPFAVPPRIDCYHCGLPVARGRDYRVVIDGTPRAMCCAGCHTVAQTIVQHGLTSYYQHRGALPASAETVPQAVHDLSAYELIEIEHALTQAVGGAAREAALMLEGVTCADTLQQVVEDVLTGNLEADHALIASMLYYIDVFPDRCHHPKEDEYLFRLLRERTSSSNTLLEDLQAQHVRGAQRVTYLQQLFVHYLAGAPDGLRNFTEAVESYATFLWNHIEQEENRVLPLAKKYLQKSDWQEIDAAFHANSDPLGGADVQRESLKLKQRITNLLPRKLQRHPRG
jgi:hemerythrin-like domain-containing protein